MVEMNYLFNIGFLASVTLSMYNIYFIYKQKNVEALIYTLKSLDESKIVLDPPFYNVILNFLIVWGSFFFSVSHLIDTRGLFLFIWFICLITLTTVDAIILTSKKYIKTHLKWFASKYTKTPESVVDFKLDAYELLSENPRFLVDLEPFKLLNDPIPKPQSIYYPLGKDDNKEDFILYTEFKEVMEIITSATPDSPFINNCILENITFLSTIMNVLKNEQFVYSLRSDLGHKKLEELRHSLQRFKHELEQSESVVKTSEINTKKQGILSDLQTIDSMQRFQIL